MTLSWAAAIGHWHRLRLWLDRISPRPNGYPIVMTDAEKSLFDREIHRSKQYLEFGFGGSSIRALLNSKATIYSVDSDQAWINKIRKFWIVRYHENRRLFIFSVDIGPTKEWGFPRSQDHRDRFEHYSSDVFYLINTTELDLVLIDGRFRVACALNLILFAHNNKNLRVLIHDFWHREQYHVLLDYLNTVEKVDSFGLFTIKQNIDLSTVKKRYDAYKLRAL